MSTPLEVANLFPAFNEIMRRHQLQPEKVQRNGTNMHIYGVGRFQCYPCGRNWESRFSWVTFDLSQQKIAKKWIMRCKVCNTDCFPVFQMTQLKEMYERAVNIYIKPKCEEVVDIGYAARRKSAQPHYPYLCEKCGWGATCCWRKFRQHFV